VHEALDAAGVQGEYDSDDSLWRIMIPWRTMVYGLIRRDVEETVFATILHTDGGWELVVRCEPVETHRAHAAGAGGVLAMAGLVWLTVGWANGIVPGFTTVLAGGLWADVARTMSLDVLDRRIRRLCEDLGSALWPGVPAQVLPPPSRLGR